MIRLACMGALRLSCYLKEEGMNEYWTKFPRLLDCEIEKENLIVMEEGYFETLAAEENNSMAKLYRLLLPIDKAGRLAWCCLEFAVLYYMNSKIGEVFEYIHTGGRNGATIALASRILYGEIAIIENPAMIKDAFSRCELLLLAEYPVRQMGNALLQADDRLIAWMEDDSSVPNHPLMRIEKIDRSMYSGVWDKTKKELVREVQESSFYSKQEIRVISIAGEKGNGRKFLVGQLAEELGKAILMVNVSFLGTMESLLQQLRIILREVLLTPALLCITDLEKRTSWESMVTVLVKEYEDTVRKAYERGIQKPPSERPLFITCTDEIKLVYLLKQVVIHKVLPTPDLVQRVTLWDFFSEKILGEKKLPSGELAIKMKLSVGNIEKVVRRLACLSKEEQALGENIYRCCYEILDDGRYQNVKRVESRYTYDDLKLEPSQKQIIKDICAQVEYRKKVLYDWNQQSRYTYGTSVSALFSGPPGTGKTMAAHIIAGILGLELYKVDVSQVVDKYIGETEKRLEEIFQKAEKSNMVLFFDEADAIIGKRVETKDAKDKYVNTEVSYLLQRMEEYDGIVILSTNYSQNIDSAFMRRIRFCVHFPLPDKEIRKEIWESSFAKETPTGNLDFEFLSSQFEFSGGQIKNVVWNACFLAAEENSRVEMEHMIRAVKMELTKEKKISFIDTFGSYAHLV